MRDLPHPPKHEHVRPVRSCKQVVILAWLQLKSCDLVHASSFNKFHWHIKQLKSMLTQHIPAAHVQMWWGCSSVGAALDRHAADAGLIPWCGQGFLSPSQLSVRTLMFVRTPLCAIACINICAPVKNPVLFVKSSVDHGNTKTTSMDHRLGSATLSQLAFPGERNLNFLWAKS